MKSIANLSLALATGLLLNSATTAIAAEGIQTARGVTEPMVDVLLSVPVPGIVTAIHFKEGDTVRKGDVILELDKRLEELEVERRQLVMDIRKLDLDATETLFEKTTAVSKEELDKKRADYRVAVVEHRMAQAELQRRFIVAPNDGVITDLILDEGESTQAYQPVVRLVDPKQCVFECNMVAPMAAMMRVGQSVRLEIDTGGESVVTTGEVAFLSPVADPASGLINAKIHFDNPRGSIRPGLAGGLILQASN